METIELNTGIQIPVIGSGTNTFGKENREYQGAINDDTTELLTAIKLGYRHFDTAISYRNEAVVGKAIKESGIDRSEFFSLADGIDRSLFDPSSVGQLGRDRRCLGGS